MNKKKENQKEGISIEIGIWKNNLYILMFAYIHWRSKFTEIFNIKSE